MKPMTILWRRLVTNGETCPRCGDTGRELEAAVGKLRTVLGSLGIEPRLQTEEIDDATFKTNSAESNRVWIQGRPLEDWLGAEVGMSRCCDACGNSDCRTIEVGGRVYETIPEEQIVKAGLIAASMMIGTSASQLTEDAQSCGCGSSGETSCQPERSGSKGSCCS